MDFVLLDTLLALTMTSILWLLYLVIQRSFLSPLAVFPGPKLAGLSFWYEFFYDVMYPGRYVFKIKELHKRYGEPGLLH